MVRRRGNGACQPDKLPWRPQSSQRRRHVARVHLRQLVLAVDSQLSMGPFCVTRSNPTHQLTDPTQPTTSGKIWTPHPTQTNTTNNGAYSLVVTFIHRTYRFPVPVRSAIKSNLTAWCNQIVSNRALNGLALSFQIFSTFAVVDPTQPKPPKTENLDPIQPNPLVNSTHGQLCVDSSVESATPGSVIVNTAVQIISSIYVLHLAQLSFASLRGF